jgi:hypothetical protein
MKWPEQGKKRDADTSDRQQETRNYRLSVPRTHSSRVSQRVFTQTDGRNHVLGTGTETRLNLILVRISEALYQPLILESDLQLNDFMCLEFEFSHIGSGNEPAGFDCHSVSESQILLPIGCLPHSSLAQYNHGTALNTPPSKPAINCSSVRLFLFLQIISLFLDSIYDSMVSVKFSLKRSLSVG